MRDRPSIEYLRSAVFLAVGALIAFVPVVRGGNRHVALIPIEWLSLLLLLLLTAFWLTRHPRHEPAVKRWEIGVALLALSPLWIGLLQLVPLPAAWWEALPGHAFYAGSSRLLGLPAIARPLSLTPDATWASVLAGLPLAAAFLAALCVSNRQVTACLRIFLFVAVAQAVIGLLQMGVFNGLYFGAQTFGRPIGTFGNSNHFANYMAMAMPLAYAAFQQRAPDGRRHRRGESGGFRQAGAALLWGVALFVLLAGVLVSRSRTGIAIALMVTFLAVLLAPSGDDTRPNWRWRLAGIGLLVVVAIGAVGLDTLLERFAGKAGGSLGFRTYLISSTWHAAWEFFPFGSGLGSYEAVYPRFQPPQVTGYAEYAHSDYVQLFMECGLAFIGLLAIACLLAGQRTIALARARAEGSQDASTALQVSCGLGLLALLLHSWVDFNLHIPANAVMASFLFGVYLRRRPAGGDGGG